MSVDSKKKYWLYYANSKAGLFMFQDWNCLSLQSLARNTIWLGTERKSRLKSNGMRFAEHCQFCYSVKWNFERV